MAYTWYILVHFQLLKCFVKTVGGAVSSHRAWCTRTGVIQETLHAVVKLITQCGLEWVNELLDIEHPYMNINEKIWRQIEPIFLRMLYIWVETLSYLRLCMESIS